MTLLERGKVYLQIDALLIKIDRADLELRDFENWQDMPKLS